MHHCCQVWRTADYWTCQNSGICTEHVSMICVQFYLRLFYVTVYVLHSTNTEQNFYVNLNFSKLPCKGLHCQRLPFMLWTFKLSVISSLAGFFLIFAKHVNLQLFSFVTILTSYLLCNMNLLYFCCKFATKVPLIYNLRFYLISYL